MTVIEFQGWPKTPRLFRDCIITEKIDGTNAAIGIRPYDGDCTPNDGIVVIPGHAPGEPDYVVYAQSRNRLVYPGGQRDNAGFAAWVYEHADTLVYDLGPGLHFGEWWGYKIHRGYGFTDPGERYFSLFNVDKHSRQDFDTPNLRVVPVLYRGRFLTSEVRCAVDELEVHGSVAAPGYDNPEGVCVFHTASRQVFKVLIDNDELPKSLVA